MEKEHSFLTLMKDWWRNGTPTWLLIKHFLTCFLLVVIGVLVWLIHLKPISILLWLIALILSISIIVDAINLVKTKGSRDYPYYDDRWHDDHDQW